MGTKTTATSSGTAGKEKGGPVVHELVTRYVKASGSWMGQCTCGYFGITVPVKKAGDVAPSTIAANFELHATKHR